MKTEIDYETGFLEEEPMPTFEYWPQYQVRSAPAWLWQMHPDDPVLDEVLRELYLALQGHLDVLAAIAVRTAFDIAMELLGIGSGLRFVQKLDQLHTDGRIAKDEKEILNRLVDAGNSAAHRGWRPTRDELNTMIDILEGFLNRAFILNAKSAKLAKGLPAKGSSAVGGPRRRTK